MFLQTTRNTLHVACAALCLTAICVASLVAGCSSSDGNTTLPDPEMFESPDAAAEATKELLATYGSTEGLPPDAIIARDVVVTTEQGSFELEGAAVVHGAAGIAQADPETGELLWRAGTCINPACIEHGDGGRPFLFVAPYGAGTIDAATGAPLKDVSIDVRCPKCNQQRTIREYLLPGVVERREQLDAEVREARRLRHAAIISGKPIPDNIRTPNEIVRERALLPRLYLPADKYLAAPQ